MIKKKRKRTKRLPEKEHPQLSDHQKPKYLRKNKKKIKMKEKNQYCLYIIK